MRNLPILAGLLALSACAAGLPAVQTPGAPPTTTSPSTLEIVTIAGTKGLIVAELAYNTAARAVVTATNAGLIRPGTPLGDRVRAANRDVSAALEVARTARTAADRSAAIRRALEGVATLGTLTPTAGSR